jgi:mRNA interferase YafQ
MLTIKFHKRYKKDYKLIVKRGYDVKKLEKVLSILANGEQLPECYKDHSLTGDYIGYRECHITPDWLLIYKICDDRLILLLTRTGSHSDLF